MQKPVVRSRIVVGKRSRRGGEGETGSFRPLAEDSYVCAKIDTGFYGVCRHSNSKKEERESRWQGTEEDVHGIMSVDGVPGQAAVE